MSDRFVLVPRETALVVIDLQRGIMKMPVAPHTAADVLGRMVQLATAFRSSGAPVVLVRVAFARDGADMLTQPRDSMTAAAREPGWDELAPELGANRGDVLITKHH